MTCCYRDEMANCPELHAFIDLLVHRSVSSDDMSRVFRTAMITVELSDNQLDKRQAFDIALTVG